MGWFGSHKPDPPDAASRQSRKVCWDSRDAYFGCLDGVGVVKAGEEGEDGVTCQYQKTQYEKNCAKSWVEYFNQRRILAERQKHLLAQMESQAEDAKTKSPNL